MWFIDDPGFFVCCHEILELKFYEFCRVHWKQTFDNFICLHHCIAMQQGRKMAAAYRYIFCVEQLYYIFTEYFLSEFFMKLIDTW